MKINFENNTIELTLADSKASSIYGSDAYKQLIAMRKDFPEFRVEVIKKNDKKDPLKGLTRDAMKHYLEVKGDETLISEFNTLNGFDSDGKRNYYIEPVSYGQLRKWFLNVCPNFNDASKTIELIMERVNKAKETQRNAEKEESVNQIFAKKAS